MRAAEQAVSIVGIVFFSTALFKTSLWRNDLLFIRSFLINHVSRPVLPGFPRLPIGTVWRRAHAFSIRLKQSAAKNVQKLIPVLDHS